MINNTVKIENRTLTIQILSVIIILLSYFTTRTIALFGGIICAIFLISHVSWEQRYSLIYFLFPFAFVFTFKAGQTSIFMILRISLLLAIIIYDFRKLTPKMITALMFFFLYSIIVSFFNELQFLRRLLNIIMWMIIIYFMQFSISEKNSTPITRSLSNGMILSSIVALDMESFPGMIDAMKSSNINVDGEIVGRFSGLMGDANLYTMLLCMCLWAMYYEFSKNRISLVEFIIRTAITIAFGFITFSKSCILIMALFAIYVIMSRNGIKTLYKYIIVCALAVGVSYYIIINPQWFDTMYLRFVGRGTSGQININTLTTGRYNLWKIYLSYMGQTDSWVFGNGLYFPMPYGRAAHNIVIQVIYYIGIAGALLYVNCFRAIYKTVLEGYEVKGVNNIGVFALLSVFAIAMFLDLMFLELFYYVVSLCFIIMKKTQPINTDTIQITP